MKRPPYDSIEARIFGVDCVVYFDWPHNQDAPSIEAVYVDDADVSPWFDGGREYTAAVEAVVEHHLQLKKETRGHYE